ncbi:hypothetical protein JCM6882_002647 [Rhodosporidiobolus microsporus]
MSDRRKSAFSSLASTSGHAQLPDALIEWVKTQPAVAGEGAAGVKKDVDGLADLKDGVALSQVLLDTDSNHFRTLANSTSNPKALAENWVLRFNNLKRLYKLLIRYFEDVLHSSTAALHTPNLQQVAKGEEGSDDEVCKLAGLVLALVVQSEHKQQHVERIQSLDEWVQRELMYSIEQVMSKVRPQEATIEEGDAEVDADSEFYAIRHEKSRIMHDKEALQVIYEDLLEQFNSLKDEHEETLSTLASAETRAAEAVATQQASQNDRNEQAYKAEIDRLRGDLQKTENQLGEAEQVVERQTKLLEELTRKSSRHLRSLITQVDDLQPRAEEAARLKDQMDEYRHASERSKKQEAVIEKYKKKLEEAAETRRMLKTLEDQNADLLDKNASLEEEYQKVSAFKPLMESYKTKLDDLESKSSSLTREAEGLRVELDRTREKLRVAEEEREKEGEALILYEERVKELEFSGAKKGGRAAALARRESVGGDDSFAATGGGVGEELDDALSGTTTTDLKLQIRRLQRELTGAKANQADASRLVVLENLLEDAQRMKKRYEGDFLKEHREKLLLNAKLEEIMSGKSKLGDGPEAAMALRQRLNATVDELEQVRKEHAELDVKLTTRDRELTVAKSDLNLVNKDQVDILRELRASVSVEKDALVEEVDRLKKSVRDADEKAKAQAEQVNKLLMEKISLQGDSISQREKELERERDYGNLKASLSAKGLSESDQARFDKLASENEAFRDQVRDMQEKLQKAKTFIKEQDKRLRTAEAAAENGNFDEAEQTYRQQITQLKEELERQKVNHSELEAYYRREQQLMLSAWHDLGMRAMRERVAATPTRGAGTAAVGPKAYQPTYQPQSWLSQQRAKAAGKGLRNA